jgi:hypothetical protein
MSNNEPCDICQLDMLLVDRIKHMYLNGQEPEDIGIILGIDYDSIRKHCQTCIKKPKSQHERYRDLIEQLEDDVGHARQAMIDRKDSPGLQQGYARLVSEYKEIIAKYEELTKPEDTVRDLVLRVMNPLIKDMLRSITEEANKLRNELQAAGTPPEVSSKLLEEFFKRSAERIKTNMNTAIVNMNSYFGAVADPTKKPKDANQSN